MRVALVYAVCVAAAWLVSLGDAMEIKPRNKKQRKAEKEQMAAYDDPERVILSNREALKCTSCLAVAWELGALLSSEEVQDINAGYGNHKANIKYASSELRLVENMERLCPLMLGYGLFKSKDTSKTAESLYQRLSDHPEASEEDQVPYAQELQRFCYALLNEHEEEVEDLIKLGTGIGAGDMEALSTMLCARTTKDCKNEAEVLRKIPSTDQYEEILKKAYQDNQKALKEEEEKALQKAEKLDEDL